MTEPSYDHRISIAQEYFRRADAGRADIVELMTEDVQLYFPKYGIGHGKKDFVEFATGMGGVFAEVQHDFRDYHFMSADRHLIVEGTTRGSMKNGKTWTAGKTPGGRFCNVFEFRGDLISRVHIYLDPDYVSKDQPRFLWGLDGRAW
jgi:ketosteroid isomerase-like protein